MCCGYFFTLVKCADDVLIINSRNEVIKKTVSVAALQCHKTSNIITEGQHLSHRISSEEKLNINLIKS